MYKTIILTLLCLLSASAFSQEAFILSGRIKASDNQSFYAPKTDNWRVQVQWILPEGEIAQEGDLVVVFDSGTIESQIEQEEAALITAEEELHKIKTTTEQQYLEDFYAEKRSLLLLEKARIDANIGIEHISRYDYEKNQLEYERAIIDKAKKQETLAQTKLANKVAVNKQEITVVKHQEKLKYNLEKLKQMSLKAKRTGPVLYANSPWTGEKIFVGLTAQPGWKIVEIPYLNGMFIEAWVHEVDYKYLTLNSDAKLTFDAYPTQPITAKLTEISTQPEARQEWGNDVYFRTKFEFTNTLELNLLPGMSAQLEFIGANDER